MAKVTVRKRGWLSDEYQPLSFPDRWEVKIFGDQSLPALMMEEINLALDKPIDCDPIEILALGHKSAIIIIDDISRPTPINQLILNVIGRLTNAGLQLNGIKILIAGGSHKKGTNDDISLKIGPNVPNEIEILSHDCKSGCLYLGNTALGTPIWINENIIKSDIKISIGSVYPHPIAGFSGGYKMLALGAAGLETIRIMHDQRKGSNHRTGNIQHPFRNEINAIGELVGLDYCINVTLNQNREISGLFSGHPMASFADAVSFYKKHYSIKIHSHSDIVIVDMYPFDMDFQFAFDRGLWPFENLKSKTTKIILANCSKGIGGHELFPISDPFSARIKRWILNLNLTDLLFIKERLNAIINIFWRRDLDPYIVSPIIQEYDMKKVLPKSKVISDWNSLLPILEKEYKGKSNIQVAFYISAPLMLGNYQENGLG